jgi:hypothetical protein
MIKHLEESGWGEGVSRAVARWVKIVPDPARDIRPAIVIDQSFDVRTEMVGKSSDKVKRGRARDKDDSVEKRWVSGGGELLADRPETLEIPE